MPLLFADSYKKIYQASPFALSTCLTFLLGVFVILMPIFAGYATDDFWDYLQVYYDQPVFGMNPNNFIIYASKKDPFGTYFVPSTSLEFCQKQLGNSLCQKPSSLTTSPDPKGNNNIIIKKTDELSISFTIPNDSNNLSNIKFMAFLDYGINSRIKFLMHTLLYLDIDINGGASIETNGELILKQRAPFTSTTITNKQYYNDEYILDSNKINPFDFVAIFDEFKNRNYTTEYKHSVRTFSEGTTVTDSASSTKETYFNVNIKIRIPKAQKILYQQKTYDNLKKAWIQYIFIFIPIFLVVYYLLSFILTNQVFPCSMKSDLGRF
jgi:hypothetical protein